MINVPVTPHNPSHEHEGSDEVNVQDLDGILADYQRIKFMSDGDDWSDVRGVKVSGELVSGKVKVDDVWVGVINNPGKLPIYKSVDDSTTQPLPTTWTDKAICELPWKMGVYMFVIGTIEISSASTTQSCYARMIHTDYTGNTIRKICATYQKEQKDVDDVMPVTFFDYIQVMGYEDYIRIQIMNDSPPDDNSYAKNCRILAHEYVAKTAGPPF